MFIYFCWFDQNKNRYIHHCSNKQTGRCVVSLFSDMMDNRAAKWKRLDLNGLLDICCSIISNRKRKSQEYSKAELTNGPNISSSPSLCISFEFFSGHESEWTMDGHFTWFCSNVVLWFCNEYRMDKLYPRLPLCSKNLMLSITRLKNDQ